MDNSELKRFIQDYNTHLDSGNPLSFEVGFIKIYVKFEKYLSNVFENYCIGIPSSKGYLPNRKLEFIDAEHLHAVLKSENKNYIDYIKKIQSLSKHIFVDNPFNIIFDVGENLSLFNQMIALRNYIVHESGESRAKYVDTCIGGKEFLEPSDFLIKKNKKKSLSYYTIFTNKIVEISELILEKPLV